MDVKKIKVPSIGGKLQTVLVDGDYDGEYLSQFPWRVIKNGYVALYQRFCWHIYDEKTGEKLGSEYPVEKYLHQWVLPPRKGCWITHKNGNKLDNRSSNLEYILPRNAAASRPLRGGAISNPKNPAYSKYRGVGRTCSSKDGKLTIYKTWTVNCGGKYIGVFDSEEDAAKAYDKAALERWGERAQLNFKGDTHGKN